MATSFQIPTPLPIKHRAECIVPRDYHRHSIPQEGVLCWDENIKFTFHYAEGVVRPNLEKAIEGCREEAVSKIGINPDNLAFVSKCLCHRGEERVRMMFSGKEKAITIEYPSHPNQWAYVMPMTLNE